jgi:hypothetical protein
MKMNGRKAKRIRREIYGKEDYRKREYYQDCYIVKHKMGFLQRLATLFLKKYREQRVYVKGIYADGLRRAYQQAKRNT